MNDFYSEFRLSDNISETPEGYLICKDVAITRAGDMYYLPDEVPNVTPVNGVVRMMRTIEDIHSQDTVSSFEGKPVTLGHPSDMEFVDPDNWKKLAVGSVQNVRPGTGKNYDKLMADLLITDKDAISDVRVNNLRQVSCGYNYDLNPISDGVGQQTNIRGNHLALVAEGRAGHECAIVDKKPLGVKMSLKDKIIGAFTKSLDEALPKDVEEKVEDKKEVEKDKSIDIKPLMEKISSLEKTVTSLVASLSAKKASDEESKKDEDEAVDEEAEDDKDDQVDEDVEVDTEVMSKAEILAPGIEASADIKSEALDQCYKTKKGKKIIDSILGGTAFDSADKNILFNAAASLMEAENNKKIHSVSKDSFTKKQLSTVDEMKKIHDAHWAKQDQQRGK